MSDRHTAKRDAFVTNAELKAELEKLPTRWEVRFLIVAGMIGAQFAPVHDAANAAIQALPF